MKKLQRQRSMIQQITGFNTSPWAGDSYGEYRIKEALDSIVSEQNSLKYKEIGSKILDDMKGEWNRLEMLRFKELSDKYGEELIAEIASGTTEIDKKLNKAWMSVEAYYDWRLALIEDTQHLLHHFLSLAFSRIDHVNQKIDSNSSVLMTETQVQAAFGISKRTLQKMRGQGRGPRYLKEGTSIRYEPFDIQEWIESRKTEKHVSSASFPVNGSGVV